MGKSDRDYRRRFDALVRFVSQMQLALRPSSRLDCTLCEYADHRLFDCEQSEFGEKLRAALQALKPELVGHHLRLVPRFLRSLRGWRRVAPGKSRHALPEAVSFAIAGVMEVRGQPDFALFERTLFSTYLRPSAALRLATLDVLSPPPAVADMGLHAVLVVSPEEREILQKPTVST